MNIIAENIEVIIPIDKVTENPFIGPEPKTNKSNAAIKVVILASRIVDKAFSKPFLMDSITLLFLKNSSLILSNIKTLASTAIPIVKTMPAIPGNVNVAPIVPNKEINKNTFAIKDIFAKIPKTP